MSSSRNEPKLVKLAVEQRLRVLQIARVEALGEPAVDRSEQITGLIPLALIAPEPQWQAACGVMG
jgi:hypothetical protein